MMNGNSSVLFLMVNMNVVGGKCKKNIFIIPYCTAKQGNSVPQDAVNADLCWFRKAIRLMAEKSTENR